MLQLFVAFRTRVMQEVYDRTMSLLLNRVGIFGRKDFRWLGLKFRTFERVFCTKSDILDQRHKKFNTCHKKSDFGPWQENK